MKSHLANTGIHCALLRRPGVPEIVFWYLLTSALDDDATASAFRSSFFYRGQDLGAKCKIRAVGLYNAVNSRQLDLRYSLWHRITSCLVSIQAGFTFHVYRLTQVVPGKRPLNGLRGSWLVVVDSSYSIVNGKRSCSLLDLTFDKVGRDGRDTVEILPAPTPRS